MKFGKLARGTAAAAVSLGVTLAISACSPGNTVDYLYVTASQQNPGQINVYAVDQLSGRLGQLQDSPYSSGGRNPVADATSPNGKNLYVINHDDNTVVMFAIGTDGKLYPQQTCNMPGTFPTQLTVSPAGNFLFIVETYQPNYNVSLPGPGAVVVFPITANGLLATGPGVNGNPGPCTPVGTFFPAGNAPVAVNVSANGNFLYVANQSDANVEAYQIASNGALTMVGTFTSSTKQMLAPSALASDPKSRFLYVTDSASNVVFGFTIQTNGSLTEMAPGTNYPFLAGTLPDGIAIDPRGEYALVANYNSNNVSAYTINQTTGYLSPNGTTPTYAAGLGPTCILIDPAIGQYAYTTNFLASNVSGMSMNATTGVLSGTLNTPFISAGQPTCSAAITHRVHLFATQ